MQYTQLTVLITGGATGIGFALAEKFHAAGNRVILVGRSAERWLKRKLLPPLVDTAMTAGRGKGKISAAQLADEFWQGFKTYRYEMRIGKAKLLALINRIAPSVAEKIMRRG
jgi:short-subunit dehydrogenase involved in D-alanine esterification of teichoic acids